MSITWKIPRNCLAWLLVAQLFLIAPHIERLPLWTLSTYVVCACWRIMVFTGRWSFPHKLIKLLLALACFFGIYTSYGSFFSLESTVALLFSGFSLKLLEVASKRDVYVIIFLGYFVALTEFLFSQSFPIVCWVLLSIVLSSTSLVALHQQDYDQFMMVSLRKAGIIFLQAIPLMVVLFIVFPRFSPMWDVPRASHQATTGISDNISPGDISELSQSDELAFRVDFQGEIPPVKTMYWRALVLSEFNGRSWQQGDWRRGPLMRAAKDKRKQSINNPIRYRIIQEPTYQPWLFALPLAVSNDADIYMTKDMRLEYKKNIHTRISYDVISDTRAVLEPELDVHSHYIETLLPRHGDTKAREFAAQLYSRADNDVEYMNKVLDYFHRQAFVYTLKPPRLGENTIDEFLFSTRQGFCSHYASSFVFLMRSVGIAARMVAGYQGGEINPITGAVLVHQFDAHAWAEVWINKRGWVRVDPTAAVAPQRIESGLQRAMAAQQNFLSDQLFSTLHYRHISWVNQLRLQMDALSYYWQSTVLQYKGERQLQVLHTLLGEVTAWRIASLLFAVSAVVVAVVVIILFRGRGRTKIEAAVRVYLRLCKSLEQAGFKRLNSEGPIDYAHRMSLSDPVWGKHLLAATRVFVALSYEPIEKEQKKSLLKQLRRESLQVRYQLHISS